MSDKIYELLNNAEINTDEYEQIALSEHEKKRIKTRFLKENARMKNKKSYKKMAAAVAVVAICSVTVTAGAAIRHALVEKNRTGNVLTVGINTEEEMSVSELSFEYGYIPEGYSEWKPNYFSKDGEYGGRGFWVKQSQGSDETFEYLEDEAETTINGKTAYCYEMGEENRVAQNVILIEYDDRGAVYKLYSNDISMEELMKVAEGMIVTETGNMIPINQDSATVYENPYIKIPEKNIVDTSESMVYPQDYDQNQGAIGKMGNLSLQSIEITNDIAGLDPEYFYNYEEKIAPYVNEDGSFKDYAKAYDNYDENGVTQESEKCGFQVVRAKFALTNTTDQKREFWVGAMNLRCLKESEEGWYDYAMVWDEMNVNDAPAGEIGSAAYFDQPQHIHGEDRSSYFYIDVDAGETIEYELAYIIYDDTELDQLYLELAPFGMGMDVSNYGTEYPKNVGAWYWKVQE